MALAQVLLGPTPFCRSRKRGLKPVADNDGKGFESFHVMDPDGFDLQIGNGRGYVEGFRKSV